MLCGHNEVVLLRRLPENHKLNACKLVPSLVLSGGAKERDQQAANMLYNLPHSDDRLDRPKWCTVEAIKEMQRMK